MTNIEKLKETIKEQIMVKEENREKPDINEKYKTMKKRKIELVNDEIKICENGNEVSIIVRRLPNSHYRIDTFLNGLELIPMKFIGQHQARSFWQMLKSQIKTSNPAE